MNKIFIVVFLGTLLLSCSPINNPAYDSTNNPTDNSMSLDIADARALLITPSTTSSKSSTENILLKVTFDGQVSEVNLLGITPSNPNPVAIYNAGSSYVVVCFGDSEYSITDGYLVKKPEGDAFLLRDVGYPYSLFWGSFINANRVQTDDAGNIYYMVRDFMKETNKVIKLDVSNPELIVKTDYTPDIDNISGFCVTPDGHIAYAYDSGDKNRIKKVNGGLHNLPNGTWLPFWVGLDGNIKYQDISGSDPNIIYTVNIDDDYNVTISSVTGMFNLNAWFQSVSSYLLKLCSRVYIVDKLNDRIYEVENSSNIPREVTFPEIDDIEIAAASDNYYYLSGSDSSNNPILLKIDPLTDKVVTLLPSEGKYYDIYKMVVSPDDEVIFNALRMFDGRKIIGEINSGGALSIIEEDLNSEVIVIEKIN